MEPIKISLGIKKIKDIEFFVDESIEIKNEENVNINFDVTTNIKKPDTSIELLITTTFSESAQNKSFLRIKVSNLFLVPELLSIPQANKDVFSLPDWLLTTMLSLSITHSRALMAKNAVGTKFQNMYIPVVNPNEVAKQIFGLDKTAK